MKIFFTDVIICFRLQHKIFLNVKQKKRVLYSIIDKRTYVNLQLVVTATLLIVLSRRALRDLKVADLLKRAIPSRRSNKNGNFFALFIAQ